MSTVNVPTAEAYAALVVQLEELKTKVDALAVTEMPQKVKDALIVVLNWVLSELGT